MRLAIIAVLLLVAAPLRAQAPEPIAAGARVRLWADGMRDRRVAHGADVERADADSILLAFADGSRVAVARERLVRVDVSEGRRPAGAGARRGVRLGTVAGGVAGLVAGAMFMGGSSSGPGSCSDCALVYGAGGAAGGALLGAVAGAIVGRGHPGDRWRTVLDRSR